MRKQLYFRDINTKARMTHDVLSCIALILTLIMTVILSERAHSESEKIYLALDADMSGNTKEAGLAIQRGIELAIDEINDAGGVHGKELSLKTFDHRANPARGIHNINKIAEEENILAVVGGVHTPVALEQLPAIHQHRVPYLGAWAAGTPIVDNSYDPNYVFRLSVRDEYAAPFFMQEIKKRGYKEIVLFLEKTGWGRSNHSALIREAAQSGITIDFTKWFFWGDKKQDFLDRMEELKRYDADAIILVANITEGAEFIKALATVPEKHKPTVISHWGISAGHLPDFTEKALQDVNLSFLQTWSPNSEDQAFVEKYCAKFGPCDSNNPIIAPVGIAHAYDLTHLFAKALNQSDTLSRQALWEHLQKIEEHKGLIKTYRKPFTETYREALGIEDFGLYKYNDNGQIMRAEELHLVE